MSTIVLSTRDERHRIGSELLEREIYAIGYITVNWAQLEHIIFLKSIEMADKAKIPIPEDVFSLSFKKRLRVWRKIIRQAYRKSKKRDRLLTLATHIGGLGRSRNRITHGLWEPDKNPERARAQSYRIPFEFEEPFDFKKLMRLGNQIGELSFQLVYPDGKREAMKNLVQTVQQRGGHVRRRGMLALIGENPEDPSRPLSTLLEDIPPRSKS